VRLLGGSSLATGFAASQPRRTAKRQTWFSAINAITAVVGASARSFACDQAATRSMLSSRSLMLARGFCFGSVERSMWRRTLQDTLKGTFPSDAAGNPVATNTTNPTSWTGNATNNSGTITAYVLCVPN
jgi:hypothetical protein